MMKRRLYILLCVVLGLMLGFLLHSLVEVLVIDRLIASADAAPYGLTWAQWFHAHTAWTVVTTAGGVIGGYFLGISWWRIVYIEKRHWRTKAK